LVLVTHLFLLFAPEKANNPATRVLGAPMPKIRVLVANRPRLMRDLVLATIADQPDIEVLGELEDDSKIAEAVAELKPDIVIIALDRPDERPAICDYLLIHYPRVKVLAVAPEDDSSVFFWSDIRSAAVESSVEGILSVIRGNKTPPVLGVM
jgi:DNA-binding NarL/FixJ family response regulator